jgi:phosphatidylserine/phosphatidylglycerophosphate/cardiolipin synthase-like enzyme
MTLARHGALVEVVAEATERRVPTRVEQLLSQGGVLFRRILHPSGLPMHCKFVLAEKGTRRWLIFGSFNWTWRSFFLNHEIAVISSDHDLFSAFSKRWEIMTA